MRNQVRESLPPVVKALVGTATPREERICRLTASTGSEQDWRQAIRLADHQEDLMEERRNRREAQAGLNLQEESEQPGYLSIIREMYEHRDEPES